MTFAKVAEASWFGLITPFHFGIPTFDLVMIVTMTLVMIVVMIESTGMFLALGDMTSGKPVTQPMLSFGPAHRWPWHADRRHLQHFPYTSFSQNVGLVGVTGVRSRFVCVAGGIILTSPDWCRRWGR